MKSILKSLVVINLILVFCFAAFAQQGEVQTFTGNIIGYNGPRVLTNNFTLRLTGTTPKPQVASYIEALANGGQDKLLDAMSKENVGTFQIGTRLSQTVNASNEVDQEGQLRVFAVFQRWMQFAEIRYGYRSTDYPFGVIELFIDPKTGKGNGTYIAAAKISMDKGKEGENPVVNIENFGTYPAKLVNVTMTMKKSK